MTDTVFTTSGPPGTTPVTPTLADTLTAAQTSAAQAAASATAAAASANTAANASTLAVAAQTAVTPIFNEIQSDVTTAANILSNVETISATVLVNANAASASAGASLASANTASSAAGTATTQATAAAASAAAAAASAASINLGNLLQKVNNLSDVASPATALSNIGGAGLASPAFTGTPTAPTATTATNTTQIATTAFVHAAIGAIGAPVTSVFGRSGTVVAASADYSFSQISGSVAASQMPALTGPVTTTAGGVATTINNIPNDTSVPGDLLITATAAPATPSSGSARVYVDSTNKVLAVKNDAGTISSTVVPSSAPSNEFATGVGANGAVAYAAAVVASSAPAGQFANAISAAGVLSYGAGAPPGQPIYGGRLTCQSGVPVITTSQTSTSLFYSPIGSQYVSIFDGSNVLPHQFLSGPTDQVGLTLALGSNWPANSVFDVFATLVGGVPVLATVQWSSSTARATALTYYAGLPVNAASATARTANATTITMAQYQGTLVGTFATIGSSGTVSWIPGSSTAGGGFGLFYIWNYANRRKLSTLVQDSNTNWTTPASWRKADNSTGNAVFWVTGLAEDGFDAVYSCFSPDNNPSDFFLGIGLNSTTTASGLVGHGYYFDQPRAALSQVSPLGLNYVQALENGGAGVNMNPSPGTGQGLSFSTMM